MTLLERKDPMKNDVLLQHDVVAQLEHELYIDDGIGVEVHHGVVKLAGHVSDFATLRNLERIARHVDGVTTVLLDVEVIGLRNINRVA
jgi:osmotically-inducible protein OsmY